MPWFIKTESFTKQTLKLEKKERKVLIAKHKSWVIKLQSLGMTISSGYLVDEKQLPGGGGLMIIKATCFEEAKSLIEKDPMITDGFVKWELHEWIPLVGKLIS